jgi:sialic acid synthase SpsE
MIVLEVGINHFGSVLEAKNILKFFLNSRYEYLSFMIQTEEFNKKYKNKLNFELPKSFYLEAIKQAKKKKKYIGLAVCDHKSYKRYTDINFNFYKLLGIAINNKDLIDLLKNKKKTIFISLSKGSDTNISKCIKLFGSKKFLKLIYTNMSYDANDLDLSRINYLKKKYKIPIGYGHHFNKDLPIHLSKIFGSEFLFIYIKHFHKKKKLYPDDKHAFFTKDLFKLENDINMAEILIKNKKKVSTKIKINEKIKF